MTDEWTRAEKRKAQSEQAKAIMDFVSMLSDKINELEKENAGLKAGRPQWHDLRKDPNDLPKGYAENTRFLCSVKGETLFLIRYGSFWQGNFEVIAWCEIPTFDKE